MSDPQEPKVEEAVEAFEFGFEFADFPLRGEQGRREPGQLAIDHVQRGGGLGGAEGQVAQQRHRLAQRAEFAQLSRLIELNMEGAVG